MGDASFPHHAESQGRIEAAPKRVFEHLDDHRRMSAHMTRRTWMMAGSRMDLRLDERMGRAVGISASKAGSSASASRSKRWSWSASRRGARSGRPCASPGWW